MQIFPTQIKRTDCLEETFYIKITEMHKNIGRHIDVRSAILTLESIGMTERKYSITIIISTF